MRLWLQTIVLISVVLVDSRGMAQEPEAQPAIRIKLNHPDQQLTEVLKLFRKAKAPHPAAALAAWKRASKEPNRLGKPVEALIAAFNPRMVGELKTLESAEVSIRFDRANGQAEWSAIFPHDDGTFEALASALVLTGGAADLPMGEVAVDRLAGPGSPLMSRTPKGTLLASDREALKMARARIEAPANPFDADLAENGLSLSVEPGSLKGSKSLLVRRLEALIRPFEKKFADVTGSINAEIEIHDGNLTGSLVYVDQRPFPKAAIDVTWFDWTPRDRAVASFALATDPGAKSWDELFALANQIEKVDPKLANVAPLRVRLGLLARLSGINLDADLLLHLVGVSGWVGTETQTIDNVFLALHLDDEAAAERIVTGAKPLGGSAPRPANPADRPRWLGQVEGQPLQITRVERDVLLTWGRNVLRSSIEVRQHPERSVGGLIRNLLQVDQTTLCAGVVWPERLPLYGPDSSPLQKDLERASPLIWQLYTTQDQALNLIVLWPQLDQFVKRFLDVIPMNPPTDH